MDNFFIRALRKGESLNDVYEMLRNAEFRRNNAVLDSINADYRDAMMIEKGLQEDPHSIVYQIAAGFLKEAEDAEGL